MTYRGKAVQENNKDIIDPFREATFNTLLLFSNPQNALVERVFIALVKPVKQVTYENYITQLHNPNNEKN